MTSIQFQIDADRLRMLHGERADSYARRRERERNAILNQDSEEAGARRNDNYDALQLADRLSRAARIQQQQRVAYQNRDVPGYSSQARANNAALRFASVGGVPLDLDSVDYEQLHEMFPAPARGGLPANQIENCSNVFRSRLIHSPQTSFLFAPSPPSHCCCSLLPLVALEAHFNDEFQV